MCGSPIFIFSFEIMLTDTIKSDFPIFTHHPNLVYLDSGASAQKPKMVIDAVKHFCETSYANIHRGLYSLSALSTDAVEKSRAQVANFVGVRPQDVIFTKNSTEASNLIARGVFGFVQKKFSDFEVVITAADHHANFLPWQVLCHQNNIPMCVAMPDEHGVFSAEDILGCITPKTKILVLPHVSNVTGQIFPIEEIKNNIDPEIFMVLDASQGIPHLPVDFSKLGVDAAFFTGHKIGAGGTGAAILSPRLFGKLEPLLYGGDMVESVTIDSYTLLPQPMCFESGTPAIENIVGLGAAIEYLQSIGGMHEVRMHEKALIAYAIQQVQTCLPDWNIIGPIDPETRSGNLTIAHPRIHHEDVGMILGEKNICVRTGFHCAHPLHQCLKSGGTVRMSFWVYTTFSDVDAIIAGLKTAEKMLG